MLILIADTDRKTKKIPNMLVFFVFLAGITEWLLVTDMVLGQRIIGGLCVSVLLLLLACVVHGSIGGGDIKLMAAAGFLLGPVGIWNAFCLGILLAGVYAAICLFIKKADLGSVIALGPFLCMGIGIVILLTS